MSSRLRSALTEDPQLHVDRPFGQRLGGMEPPKFVVYSFAPSEERTNSIHFCLAYLLLSPFSSVSSPPRLHISSCLSILEFPGVLALHLTLYSYCTGAVIACASLDASRTLNPFSSRLAVDHPDACDDPVPSVAFKTAGRRQSELKRAPSSLERV